MPLISLSRWDFSFNCIERLFFFSYFQHKTPIKMCCYTLIWNLVWTVFRQTYCCEDTQVGIQGELCRFWIKFFRRSIDTISVYLIPLYVIASRYVLIEIREYRLYYMYIYRMKPWHMYAF